MSDKRQEERRRVSGRRRAEEHKTGFDSTVIKLPSGSHSFNLSAAGIRKIDIIPYRVGKGNPWAEQGDIHPERTYWTHRDIGPNGDSFVCLAKTAKQKCPVCEYRARLAKDPDSDEDLIKSLAPKERQLWNVIDLDDREKGIQIWDISFHLFGKQLDERVKNADEEDGYEFYADLQDGFHLRLGVAEKSFGGRNFYEVTTIDFKPRREKYGDEMLDKAFVLDDLLILPEYEKLKAIFLQTDEAGDEKPAEKKEKEQKGDKKDDDDWDSPPPSRAKKEETKTEPKKEEKPKPKDEDRLVCPACESKGVSSKGGKCKPCNGTGYLDTSDDGPAEPPKKTEQKEEQPKSKKGGDDWDDGWDKPEKINPKSEAKPEQKKEAAKATSGDDEWN